MSEETELIKERVDIAEVVGEYVGLKRSGNYFKGLCPFHQEKTPSFVVTPDKGLWHCFGACGEGGDVFSFIQKVEGVEFPAALKLLAERAGVELKSARLRQGYGGQAGGQSRRQRVFDLLELSARFYNEILFNQAAGKKALEYMLKRGVKAESMKAFTLGYAPKQWDLLQNFLRAKGYSPQEMVAAGVVGESNQGKLFDRFRGRIIFPVSDTQGRVVAFGARITPWHETGEEGKYINSPETELYQKRRVVYNLARAKRQLKGKEACLVVEGYMDVVMLDQVGVKSVVASSGTAFTEEHILQLKRFTNTLHFAFDADAAGVKAGIAATQAALAAGMRVATVVLPPGQDPADVAKADPKKLKALLAAPRSLVSVLLDHLQAAEDAGAQEDYLAVLLPLVARVTNPVQQGEMVQEMSRMLAVPEARVVQLLEQQGMQVTRALPWREVTPEPSEGGLLGSAEQYAVGLLVGQTGLRKKMLGLLAEDDFSEENARELYILCREGKSVPDELASYAEGVSNISGERMAQSADTPEREMEALVATLQQRRVKRQLTDLQEKLMRGNDRQRTQALKKFRELTEELSRLHT